MLGLWGLFRCEWESIYERARAPGKKFSEDGPWSNLFFASASMVLKGEIGAPKIQESVLKKFKNAFFYEI
jgi:hypothetical protein